MKKQKDPIEVFELVSKGKMSIDEFVEWYQSVRISEYSYGYKEASAIAYMSGKY